MAGRIASPKANLGKSFESELEQTHAYYQRMRLAWICRLHVRTTVSHGLPVYLARTACDYMGYLLGGRAILLESKSSGDPNKKLWKPDRPHQLSAIQQANRAEALGFYIIRVGLESARIWKPPEDYDGKSVRLDELPELRRGWGEVVWDWLPSVC